VLSTGQLAKLIELSDLWFGSLEFPSVPDDISERVFTAKYLYPRVDEWVRSLATPSLVVRSDGSTPPRRLSLEETTFVPDLEIGEHNATYVAVEVKLLKTTNSSAAITKAIGQAVVYRSLGFESSHVVIVDLRPKVGPSRISVAAWEVLAGSGLTVHWYRLSQGRLRNVRGGGGATQVEEIVK
jgi:hypothetical protein